MKSTVCFCLLLFFPAVAWAQCSGPELVGVETTKEVYELLERLDNKEQDVEGMQTLLTWSPLLALAGGKWAGVDLSILSTDWEELALANQRLQTVLYRQLQADVQMFLANYDTTLPPRTRRFLRALADYYGCIAP